MTLQLDPGACGLLQLRHSVPGSVLYSSYWYRSGINRTMTENLHEIADAGGRSGRRPGARRPRDRRRLQRRHAARPLPGLAEGVRSLGMDPSDVTRYAVAKGHDVINDFFSYEALQRALSRRAGADHHEHRDVLRPRGAGSLRRRHRRARSRPTASGSASSRYMPTMLEMNSFDTVCHEHLEYYSLAVIERVLATEGSRSCASS